MLIVFRNKRFNYLLLALIISYQEEEIMIVTIEVKGPGLTFLGVKDASSIHCRISCTLHP